MLNLAGRLLGGRAEFVLGVSLLTLCILVPPAFAAAPKITSVSPTSGPTTGGTKVTIFGTNLQFASSVTFGGTNATSFGYNTSTGDLYAYTPARNAGTVSIKVVTSGGSDTESNAFTYLSSSSTGTITGTVRNSLTDAGISNATVSFDGKTTTTSSSGGYTLSSVECDSSTFRVTKSGYEDESFSYTPSNCPGTSTKNVTLVPIPSITSVTPDSGPTSGGTLVTILGQNLQFASAVTFGGTPAASFSYSTSTGDLQATTPAHAAGAVSVKVTTPAGSDTESNGFTYGASSSTGTLTGTVRNLLMGTAVSGASVSFSGKTTTSSSSGAYTLTGIACAAGTLDVTKSGYQDWSSGYTPDNCPGTSTRDVALAAIPSITSVAPNSGPTTGGTLVTILGENLQFASAVTFGGTPALSFSYSTSTGDLQATTPAHAAGAVSVKVTTPAGSDTESNGFTYGTSSSTGTLTGTVRNLLMGTAVSGASVSFSGKTTTSSSSGAFTLTGIACAAGTLNVTKSGYQDWSSGYTPDNCPGTSTRDVALAAIPSITSVAPNSGPTTGGTLVTILGENLQFASAVTFGGTPALSFSYSTSTGDLQATTPAHAAGAVSVKVTTPAGSDTESNGFTYGTSSSTGTLTGTVRNLLMGTAVSGASVSFGGKSTTSSSSGAYTLTGIACAAGTLNVTKSGYQDWSSGYTPDNCPGTSTRDVALAAIPSITSVAPNSGPTTGGTLVTILGENLQFASAVTFGGTPAVSFSYSTSTGDLQATTPAHAAGAVNVKVTTPAGSDTESNGFTYASVGSAIPDLVTESLEVSPSSGSPGSSVNVAFRIRNQGSGSANASTANIRLSTSSSAPSTNDPLLTSISVPGIAAGAAYSDTSSVAIPAGTSTGTRYIWMILDVNGTAGQGAPNQGNDRAGKPFTVASPSGLLPPPSLTAPANDATGVSATPSFGWSAVAGANRYWITVATDSDALPNDPGVQSCPSCAISCLIQSPSHTAGTSCLSGDSEALIPGTRYSWRVQASNTDGTKGNYSSIRLFTVAGESGGCMVQCSASVAATGDAGDAITFRGSGSEDDCSGSIAYSWDFGDGGGATDATTTHIYASAGSYDWTFTAAAGGETCQRSGRISIGTGSGAPQAAFTADPAIPTVGGTARFQDRSTGPPDRWAWDFDSDGVVDATTRSPSYIFRSAGQIPVKLQVWRGALTSSATRTIEVRESESTSTPQITNIASEFGRCFMDGISIRNRFDVAVDWKGTPGVVAYAVNGGQFANAVATSSGASFDVDTGALTGAHTFEDILAIRATSADGRKTSSSEFRLRTYPVPSWLGRATRAVTFSRGQAEIGFTVEIPADPIRFRVDDMPSWVPYFGSRPTGLRDTQLIVEVEASTNCSVSLSGGGQTGLEAGGVTVLGSLVGGGEASFSPTHGLMVTKGFLNLKVDGEIEGSEPVLKLIPQTRPLCALHMMNALCSKLQLKGQIGAAVALGTGWSADETGVRFSGAEATPELRLRGGLELKLSELLYAYLYGTLNAEITLGIPKPYFRGMSLRGGFGLEYRAYLLTGTIESTFGCDWDPERTCSQLPNLRADALEELPLSVIPPRVRRGGHRGIRALGENVVLDDVFRLATPAVVVHDGNVLALFVEEDTNHPNTLQRTNVWFTRATGPSWSAAEPLTRDDLGEFAPALVPFGRDLIGLWLRSRNATISGNDVRSLSELPKLNREMEIVASTFSADSGLWSPGEALTSNDVLDYGVVAAQAGNQAIAVWLRDSANELGGTGSSGSMIVARVRNAQGWGLERILARDLRGTTALAIDASGSEATVVYSRDRDFNAETGDDREIAYLTYRDGSWTPAQDLTNDGVEDQSPRVVYDSSGVRRFLWLRNGNLVWRTDAGSIETLRTDSSIGLLDFDAAVSRSGRIAVVWADMIDGAPDIVARIFDPQTNSWSDDIVLTRSAARESMISALFDRDALQVVAVETAGEGNDAHSELVHYARDLTIDLTIRPAAQVITPPSPAVGTTAQIAVELLNTGALPVRDVTVAVNAPNGTMLQSQKVAGVWRAGEIRPMRFDVTRTAAVPAVTIVVDPEGVTGDGARNNNSVTLSFANQAPAACIQLSSTTGLPPLDVTADASCSRDADGPIAAYEWSTDDGQAASGPRAAFRFTGTGTTSIVLRVTDAMGASTVASARVQTGLATDHRRDTGANRRIIPAIGKVRGNAGTNWISDLTIANPDPNEDAVVEAYYMPDGRSDFFQTSMVIPAGQIVDARDAVASAFSAPSTSGWLQVNSSRQGTLVTSRTYNDQPHGTYGLYAAAVGEGEAIRKGGRRVFLQHWAPGYRTNVGFAEIDGNPATVKVEVFDHQGKTAGTRTFDLRPFGRTQAGDPLFERAGRIEITTTTGAVVAYTSTIDNQSGDSIYQSGVVASAMKSPAELLIPIVGRVRGANDTDFRSDVRIFNPEKAAQNITLQFITSSRTYEKTVTVAAGATAAYDDVVTVLFSGAGTGVTGALMVSAPKRIELTARTYNYTPSGTFGQFTPARPKAALLARGDTAHLVQLSANADYRCNLGLTSGASAARIRVRAYDRFGKLLGQKTYDVPAGQNRQVGHVFADLGVTSALDSARLVLTVVDGSAVYAYASVIDNRTGDAVFVEAME